MTPAQTERLCAVFGHPVAHSLSPQIHAAFASACGITLRYDRMDPGSDAPSDFARVLEAFAQRGGIGCNVTLPFKAAAHALATHLSERAKNAQAVNTLKREGQEWFGDNTDGAGLLADLQQGDGEGAPVQLARSRILIFGSGGAARGIIAPLLQAAPAHLHLAARRPDAAHSLAESFSDLARSTGTALTTSSLMDCAQATASAFDLIINATSASVQGQSLPLAPELIRGGALALDLMYGAPAQIFLRQAAALGARTRDGLGMLVQQAALSFQVFHGIAAEPLPVLRFLREGLGQP